MWFYIILAAWLLSGYICWRLMYYGFIYDFHTKFGINIIRQHRGMLPIVVIMGPISFICLYITNCMTGDKFTLKWYYKIP
jgi:hypothetical protein